VLLVIAPAVVAFSQQLEPIIAPSVQAKPDVVMNTGTISAVDQNVTIERVPVLPPVAIIQITGTWTGNLVPEAQLDGTTWVTVTVTDLGGALSQTNVSTNGFLRFGGAMRGFRLRASSWTSGTASITIIAGPFSDGRFSTFVNQNVAGIGGSSNPWSVVPQQRGPLNSVATSAANAAVTTTIAAAASTRPHLYRVDAYCSAGTAQLTVADGATTIWQTPAAAVGTTMFTTTWPTPLTGSVNTNMTITLGTCGVGNTGTLIVQADRW